MEETHTLQLKDIALYLPYGLKGYCMGLVEDDYAEPKVPIITHVVGLGKFFVDVHYKERTLSEQYEYSDFFPILRNLSDLTKEIEVNGKRFVPEKLLFDLKIVDQDSDIVLAMSLNDCQGSFQQVYVLFEKLFEWHFDVFGLIDKGLAIDLNTITNG